MQHLDKAFDVHGWLPAVAGQQPRPRSPVTISRAFWSVRGASLVTWSPRTSTATPPRPKTTSGPKEGSCEGPDDRLDAPLGDHRLDASPRTSTRRTTCHRLVGRATASCPAGRAARHRLRSCARARAPSAPPARRAPRQACPASSALWASTRAQYRDPETRPGLPSPRGPVTKPGVIAPRVVVGQAPPRLVDVDALQPGAAPSGRRRHSA